MEYIDKHELQDEGNSITEDYLENQCKVYDEVSHCYRYINIDYSGSFASSGYRDRMCDLALRSQTRYCCYCLRKLSDVKYVTLEHIIPQQSKTCDRYNFFPELAPSKVVLTDDFQKGEDQSRPPYPHSVAWNNLVASCNGCFPESIGKTSVCCNNKRSSKEALPVYYYSDIADSIEYMPDGTMMATPSPRQQYIQTTINSANLNCQALKEIRKLWLLFSDYSLQYIYEEGRKEHTRKLLLLSVLDLEKRNDENLFSKYMKEEYWRCFMSYQKFHEIFSS